MKDSSTPKFANVVAVIVTIMILAVLAAGAVKLIVWMFS